MDRNKLTQIKILIGYFALNIVKTLSRVQWWTLIVNLMKSEVRNIKKKDKKIKKKFYYKEMVIL